jgi:hypothetical protein
MSAILAWLSFAAMAVFAQGGVLDLANSKRELHQAPRMDEDGRLSAYAQSFADKLAAQSGVSLQHSGGPYGENLAFIYTQTEQPYQFYVDRAVGMWYAEETAYDYAAGVFSMQAGHFTQLVWRTSTMAGVGVARRGTLTYVVMSFSPPGNKQGAFLYNVLPLLLPARSPPPVPQPPPAPRPTLRSPPLPRPPRQISSIRITVLGQRYLCMPTA